MTNRIARFYQPSSPVYDIVIPGPDGEDFVFTQAFTAEEALADLKDVEAMHLDDPESLGRPVLRIRHKDDPTYIEPDV